MSKPDERPSAGYPTADEIYALSAERVRRALAGYRLDPDLVPYVERMVHACGDASIAPRVRISRTRRGGKLRDVVVAAVESRAFVLCDTEMIKSAVVKRLADPARAIVMRADDSEINRRDQTAASLAMAAAVDKIADSVVLIGSNPTALTRLLDGLIDENWPRPAALIAVPVGFVGAARSKSRLSRLDFDFPWLTLLGRRGGAALGAAAFNSCFIRDLGHYR